MKRILKYSSLLLISMIFLTSCSESRKKAAERINELNQHAEDLNSVVKDGLKTVESLDSVVRSGTEQLREYDSLIQSGSLKIDSIAKEKTKAWEELTSF